MTDRDWILALFGINAVGLFFVLLYAAQYQLASAMAIASTGILMAGTSLLLGALVGFLFGVPRSLQQQDRSAEEARDKADGTQSPSNSIRYEPNTNLEQISDWLTKILVGVGLTQLTRIPAKLALLGRYLGPALGGARGVAFSRADGFALVLVLFFLTGGFLFGYLWTRIFLGSLLTRADLADVETMREVFREGTDARAQADAGALILAHRFLAKPTPGDEPKISVDDLKRAIKAASPSVKVQIFYQAETVRKCDPELMETTIPIFEALVESDPEGKFHRNYGQLGYALKDKTPPDWAAAEKALTKAIEIRGSWQKGGWLSYEFNRALCRIRLDEEFSRNLPSREVASRGIVEDLQAIASNPNLKPHLSESPIREWIQLNREAARSLLTA